MEAIPKRPFWAAPLLRRKFEAKRRIAQGRLCRLRAFQCRRVEPPYRRQGPKKKHLLSRCFFLGKRKQYGCRFLPENLMTISIGITAYRASCPSANSSLWNMDGILGVQHNLSDIRSTPPTYLITRNYTYLVSHRPSKNALL